jgi:SAM-dependent methyltransferase
MTQSTNDYLCSDTFEPSRLVRKFGSKALDAAANKPILDVACGSGRNAIFFAELGGTVICLDKNLNQLRSYETRRMQTLPAKHNPLELHQLDLIKEPWPFIAGSVGGIVNIHFFLPSLFPHFENSLSPGGYLLFESVPGCGGNYLELPPAGYIRSLLANGFEIEIYKEKKVGPVSSDTVTTQVVAKRKMNRMWSSR